jgi:HTH-type transcriptional regulator/antitoxin HipB
MTRAAQERIAEEDQLVLGRALRALRNRAGMTQEQVAEQLGSDATFVSRIERGLRGVRWPTLQRFLRVYGGNLHDLADAVDDAKQL